MKEPLLDFDPSVFWRVLAASLLIVFAGWTAAYRLLGELKTVDICGSLLCAPLFAYLVHLWIIYNRDDGG